MNPGQLGLCGGLIKPRAGGRTGPSGILFAGTRPFWLKPSRVKGSVLFLSIPWKVGLLSSFARWRVPELELSWAFFIAKWIFL